MDARYAACNRLANKAVPAEELSGMHQKQMVVMDKSSERRDLDSEVRFVLCTLCVPCTPVGCPWL